MSLKAILYIMLYGYGLLRTLSVPFVGVLTFVCITYLRPEVFSYGVLTSLKLPFVISIVLLISALLNRDTRLMLGLRNNATLWFLFLTALFQILSSSNAVNPDESYYYAFTTLKIAVFCYLIVALCDDEQKFSRFLDCNVAAGGFLVLWSVLHHFHGNERLEEVGGGGTATSNGIAALFLLLLPLIVSRFGDKRRNNLVLTLLCFTTCVDIVFTQSRSAFVGLVVGGVYFLLRYPSKRKFLAVLALLVVFPVVASNTRMGDETFSERIGNMLEKKMDVDASATSRKTLWNFAYQVFTENALIGVGQQQFKYHSKRLMAEEKLELGATDAHNTLLLVLVEGGVLTLGCYLGAILAFFGYTRKIRRLCKDDLSLQGMYKTAVCLEFSIIAFLVTAMAHSYVTIEYFYWILMLPSVMLRLIDSRQSQEAAEPSRSDAAVAPA